MKDMCVLLRRHTPVRGAQLAALRLLVHAAALFEPFATRWLRSVEIGQG